MTTAQGQRFRSVGIALLFSAMTAAVLLAVSKPGPHHVTSSEGVAPQTPDKTAPGHPSPKIDGSATPQLISDDIAYSRFFGTIGRWPEASAELRGYVRYVSRVASSNADQHGVDWAARASALHRIASAYRSRAAVIGTDGAGRSALVLEARGRVARELDEAFAADIGRFVEMHVKRHVMVFASSPVQHAH